MGLWGQMAANLFVAAGALAIGAVILRKQGATSGATAPGDRKVTDLDLPAPKGEITKGHGPVLTPVPGETIGVRPADAPNETLVIGHDGNGIMTAPEPGGGDSSGNIRPPAATQVLGEAPTPTKPDDQKPLQLTPTNLIDLVHGHSIGITRRQKADTFAEWAPKTGMWI